MSILIFILAGMVLVQQVFFMYQIQKLLDKAMSRSYTEYVRAKDERPKVQVPNEPMDDLSPLSEFSIL